jgi:membrane-bound serine protease (ClpP class)
VSVEAALCVWIIGWGLLVAELFVPGMILGGLGVLAVIVGIGAMFLQEQGGAAWGGGLTLVSLVLGAVLIKVGAARLTHRHTLDDETYSGTDDRSDLIGQEGVTATILRPGGFATIGDERIDVVTGGEVIEAGTPVVVTKVEGNRIQVRATA